jgi:hypothetical protein
MTLYYALFVFCVPDAMCVHISQERLRYLIRMAPTCVPDIQYVPGDKLQPG